MSSLVHVAEPGEIHRRGSLRSAYLAAGNESASCELADRGGVLLRLAAPAHASTQWTGVDKNGVMFEAPLRLVNLTGGATASLEFS
jgi:hypothetical protein